MKTNQIQLQPEDKLEAEHTIVEKHGTVSRVVMNKNDKVLISPDESGDVLKENNRVTMIHFVTQVELSEYEKYVAEKRKRNQEYLKQLGLQSVAKCPAVMKKKGSKKRSSVRATDKSKEGGTTGKADGTKEDGATKATYTPKPADGDAANTPIIAEVSLYISFLCY